MSEAAVHLNQIHFMPCVGDSSLGLLIDLLQAVTRTYAMWHVQQLQSVLCNACSKDFHRSAKNSWLPVFNSASLEISSKEMNVGADRLAAILSRAAQEGRELNIWRQFGHMTMDVVGSAAFGSARSYSLSTGVPHSAGCLPYLQPLCCTQDATRELSCSAKGGCRKAQR